MKTTFNNLLTPKFEDNFEVTLNYPLWITEDPLTLKRECKRGLLEVAETYKKVSLAYSGGSDSGFLLCCLRDLINEGKLKKDTIEVFQGVFLLGGIPQDDAARATRFAHSLGFDHKIYNLEIDDTIHNKVIDYTLNFISRYNTTQENYYNTYVCSLQDIVSEMHGDTIIRAVFTASQTFSPRITDGVIVDNDDNHWDIPVNMVTHYDPDSPNPHEIEFFLWDNRIYSCFISPFKLKRRLIDSEPLPEISMSVPTHPNYFNKYLDKWMIYLQCYPEMSEILFKIPSLNREARAKDIRIIEFTEYLKETYPDQKKCFAKKPNGQYFTRQDLLNYEEYFDVS